MKEQIQEDGERQHCHMEKHVQNDYHNQRNVHFLLLV